MTDFDQYAGDAAVRTAWDERYAEGERLWSGQPNGALVAEVGDLPPGRVLDVGCGEGADSVWLARQGWDVTGLEVSGIALQRAAAHAREAGVQARWVHAELHEAGLEPGSFDLVSAQYPALFKTPNDVNERLLLSLVAPGGSLLFVHHVVLHDHRHEHDDFDPDDYVQPHDMDAVLDDNWTVEVNETRVRPAPSSGAGAHHSEDVVLRIRRTS